MLLQCNSLGSLSQYTRYTLPYNIEGLVDVISTVVLKHEHYIGIVFHGTISTYFPISVNYRGRYNYCIYNVVCFKIFVLFVCFQLFPW